MTIQHTSLSVGTGAAVDARASLSDKSGVGFDGLALRLILTNEGANAVHVGDSTVTTSSYGYKIAANGVLDLELDASDYPYLIAGTGTNTVRALFVRA